MKIVVLLSAGRHPASGAPRPVPVELQAIGLARALPGAEIVGLHAGVADAAVADALGHGLASITVLLMAAGDPLPALAAELAAMQPDLVLAGRRGTGGADTGMLPYRLARALGMTIVADAMAVASEGENLAVVQALPRGARRRVVARLPALVTVHEAAPAALPYVHRARLAGRIAEKPGIGAFVPALEVEIRPYRARPKLIGDGGSGGSAEDRLRAATEAASAGGRLMVGPTADEAAEAILAYVRRFRVGVNSASARD